MVSPITLDALRVLDAIERKQSFAAAADELYRVPSAVSYTVSKLEQDLNVELFDRSKRKAQLTAIGKMMVEQGRLILHATDELTHIAIQSSDGWEAELRICIDNILRIEPLYQLIAQFSQLYPWIDIKVSEEMLGGTWDALNAGRCDLVIGAIGDSLNREFDAIDIGNVEFVFAVAADHALCEEIVPLTESMIKQYPSVVVADSSRDLPRLSAGLFDGQSRITVPRMETKIAAQCQGLGVGYLPVHRITDELASGKLVALNLAEPKVRDHNLSIAWRKDNKGKALAWFVKALKELDRSLLFEGAGN